MIDKKHILQTMDWSKYDLPNWLRQCGAWQQSCGNGYSLSNPIAVAMKKAKLRISKNQRAKLIAYYLCDEEPQKAKRNRRVCQITDDEARAVQRLVLDFINGTDSEALLEWMEALLAVTLIVGHGLNWRIQTVQ